MRYLLSLLCFVSILGGRSVGADEAWRVSGKNCHLGLRSGDGAIEYFGRPGGGESIFRSGPAGLWEATLADGRALRAADFTGPQRTVTFRPEAGSRRTRLEFRSAELDVTVVAEAGENCVDLWADVTPHASPVLSFGLPGRLEFSPQHLVRLVTPASGNESVGYALRPGFFEEHPGKRANTRTYYEYRSMYPPAFADFFHWDTRQGSAAVYRMAPRTWEPWQATKDPKAIFVPGRIATGGSKAGAWCERPFAVHLAVGQTWRSPTVRLLLGLAAGESLAAYCRDNRIERRLEQKMSADTLEKFKQAVLVLYWGDCQQKRAHLDKLPRPTLVHFADYLHGGFDKQYPDHLPPAPSFGTADEFREFLREANRLGHLTMPYTNPTWWCDGPRGPTFAEHGEEPLLRQLDGRLFHERYSKNEGFTICHWHPAVQAANRKTITQFSQEFPVDVVFQDQCGARRWHYDLNRASPTPYAYTEGLLSMVAEDARRKPLSTESGWDGVVNDESQLCGMTWNIVPTEGKPDWVRTMRDRFDPATWEVFPVAQYIAHDKTAMVHHDLGQFVTNAEVLSWTLGLGFAMSARTSAEGLTREAARQWLAWLDRLQKSVCARYVGQPVARFVHDRRGQTADDGVIRAAYGDVQIVANLGPRPLRENGRELAEYGFLCTAPGMVAACLRSLGGSDFGPQGISFVSQEKPGGADVWVYAAPEQRVAVLVPGLRQANAAVACDGGPSTDAAVRDGVCTFRLPALPDRKRIEPPPELARAPRDWPGPRPAVGVVDFGPRIGTGWTRITPRDWLDAFRKSRLAKEFGVPVRAIQTPAELAAALAAGPTAWLAIVNPYGESFPAIGTGRATIEAIRKYVNHGGSWWETGGYSLYTAVHFEGDQVRREPLGPGGMDGLGLSVGHGEVEQRAEPLSATAAGRQWLAAELVERIDRSQAIVNRALPRGVIDAPHLTLVGSGTQDYIGAYRLEGWGWLWRVGGFWPDRELALPVAVGATEYLYTHAPPPAEIGSARRVWHASVQGR